MPSPGLLIPQSVMDLDTPGLTHTDRAVLAVLIEDQTPGGPMRVQIAKRLRMQARSLYKTLHRLHSMGLIKYSTQDGTIYLEGSALSSLNHPNAM